MRAACEERIALAAFPRHAPHAPPCFHAPWRGYTHLNVSRRCSARFHGHACESILTHLPHLRACVLQGGCALEVHFPEVDKTSAFRASHKCNKGRPYP